MKTIEELAKELQDACNKDARLFGKVSRVVLHKALLEAAAIAKRPPEPEKPKPAPKKEPEPHVVSPPLENLEMYRALQAAEGKLYKLTLAVREVLQEYEGRHWHRFGTCVPGDYINSERGCAVCIVRSFLR